MIATHLVRTLDVSAGSGLVLRDGVFHVVADDENGLFVFAADGPTRRIPLLPGELPAEHAARKALKPDFEILIDLGDDGLLAMGSGSRATRERAVLVDRDGLGTVIDTAPLCAALRGSFAALNLEGGVLTADALVLLQRGNRSDRRAALVFVAIDDLRHALATRKFAPARAPRIVDIDLGSHEGSGDPHDPGAHDAVPWSCTDLAVLAGGDLLASAVREDTADAYADGPCLGSALARLAPDGSVRWLRRLDTLAKVEGIAVDGDSVWLVSDADDRAVPSRLLRARLP